ncbi:helix-turn-helix transcriptional regulator [Actinomadura sp. DC4]|uniref:helix-turn-helix transcriptional regulator n=1 Tax=Actinomadura sp. DC4 TaxID=3055069 RepID=UPI0025B03754|nr:helix-turn-helix transcriptional regulator [Actinomadura sp. DC4]MDN3351197.1 helix-turn-helix transcriptional regulator [Actinomadura sp. DC4]
MASKRVRLARSRKAAGFSQERLAEHLGVERTTVGRWESAETEPHPWTRPKLARALKITADQLQELLDDVVQVQKRGSERLSYVLQHPSSVDLVAVAYLHERVRELDQSYDQSPSTALLGPTGHVHGQVGYLRENATNARVKKALYEVEAGSATLMGQLVWDVSQRRDLQGPNRYFDEAVRAARLVRDPCAESYAVLRKSYVALYGEKDPEKGLMLADEAAEVAKLCSPSLTGLSLLHAAESHAITGRLKETEDALRKAEAQFERIDGDDVASEHYTINEFNRLVGSCYLFLDLPDRAEPILQSTVQALSAKKKSQSIALANLTLSLIRQRKLDEVVVTMHRTIDAVEQTRGGGGLSLAFAAGRELRQWHGEAWVRDIHDRLLSLMAAV